VLKGKLGWGYEPVLEASERVRQPHPGRLCRPGGLPLLSGASLFVYPSLAEGFGFPPLEAMACGVPTIAARSTSLVENLEGAAELVPADDAPALAAAILKVLRDPGIRSALRERGRERAARFRWPDRGAHRGVLPRARPGDEAGARAGSLE
jgi:glycosyltransferase involved in cell wall biosynthesis